MKNISISVVICTYNGEKYIVEQIESILEQTLLPKEIVVGDDGSNDETLLRIEELRSKIEEKGIYLTIYKNHHLGAHGNFKATLPKATCDLIAPCDQDDIWMSEKLEKCAEAMVEGVDMVACRDVIRNEDDSTSDSLPQTLLLNRLLWGNTIPGHVMLFRRKVLNVYNVSPTVTFDWGIALYSGATGTGKLIPYLGCVWRRHPGVVTTEFSNNKGYKSVSGGKWTNWGRTMFLLMQRKRSKPIEITMDNIRRIYSYYGQPTYAEIAALMSLQTVGSLLKACWRYMKLSWTFPEFIKLNLHDKIGYSLHNFCYPTTWWYTYHLHRSL